ncbi:hypothetical protein [Agarivorans sp. JK6]|uniref:hypothetical protein n=1 Tax=Agarivorans sp. JK6 TaxID=2997426 RepID=UPI003873322A
MKKTILIASITSLLSTAALAGPYVEAYADKIDAKTGDVVYGGIVGYSFNFGTSIEAEYDSDKDLELTAAHKFEINDTFYVKPSAAYVFTNGDSEHSITGNIDSRHFSKENPGIFNVYEDGLNSDVYKLGLELGAKFNNGVFTALRYRYEGDVSAYNLGVKGHYNNDGPTMDIQPDVQFNELFSASKGAIGRTDLTLGWAHELVELRTKAINKRQLNKDHGDRNTMDYELQLTYKGLGSFAPYARVTNVELHDSRDNQFKLGASYQF